MGLLAELSLAWLAAVATTSCGCGLLLWRVLAANSVTSEITHAKQVPGALLQHCCANDGGSSQ